MICTPLVSGLLSVYLTEHLGNNLSLLFAIVQNHQSVESFAALPNTSH